MMTSKILTSGKNITIIIIALIATAYLIEINLPILPSLARYAGIVPSSKLEESSVQSGSFDALSYPGSLTGLEWRNATWRFPIGEWLSRCGAPPVISISERFPSKKCENDCGGRGVCNHQLGECRCFHGFSGSGCEIELEFPCTIEGERWRVSSCGASCDKSKAFCVCGEGTKYPRRPVMEACGFMVNNGRTDWSKRDPQIFSNSTGWCNLDLDKVTRPLKKECYCTIDGSDGPLCQNHVESFCYNECSGNGRCRGGFCACVGGWHGIDCSVPSAVHLDLQRLPAWLPTSTITIPGPDPDPDPREETKTLYMSVEKRRPLIYVYDLPAELNIHLVEGRHFRLWCASRNYDDQNRTVWLDNLYGAEPALLESFLASPHRTTNAKEADFFYVPTLEACARQQADSAPHTDMQREYLGLRGYYSGDFHREAYEHIKEAYPYWNRSGGTDHIWMFSWDEGACSAPKEIWNSIMLVHWGNTNSKYNHSTTAYSADNWMEIPTEFRGNHPCYDPSKDIVLPSWKKPNPFLMRQQLLTTPREKRTFLFYFNGNLGSMYGGRPETEYSMGIRQRLADEFGSLPNKYGKMGGQRAPDVIIKDHKTRDYGLELSESRFCGVFPGDGWSGRMEDSIMHGCIPVIIQDGIHLPFEDVLDYNAFAVRIPEEDLPNMVNILRGINESKVESMLSAVRKMWQRFIYHDSVKREAQRQQPLHPVEAPWAVEYSKLVDDDAFDTLIQVLHFKLGARQTNLTEVSRDTTRALSRDYCGNQ